MSSGIALLPIGPGPRNHVGEQRPRTAPSSSMAHAPHLGRSPQPFVRPQLPKINVDPLKNPGSSRRTSGNLALQARDSLAVRKRTLSTGAMSARAARHLARKAAAAKNQAKLENTTKDPCPAGSMHARPESPSADTTPSTRTDSHPNRRSSRSPTHSQLNRRSSSPPPTPSSSSSAPITPAHNTESAAPSSYHTRAQTHVPQNSHGTATSAYPASTSQSSRSTTPVSEARSRTTSPLPPAKASSPVSPRALLDLDPDDVNARLRLLVNNSYFLPPAHVKPELTPIYLAPSMVKHNASRPLSPSAFKDFFRVGKKKDKKAVPEASNGGPARRDIPQPSASAPVTARDNYFDLPSEMPSRHRVVVVRETVEDLPIPAPPRAPYRSSSFPTRSRNDKRGSIIDTIFIDPTTQYDVPPPTHYPSYQKLGIDVAGINGDAQLDQFAPPGSPWSPSPSASRTMDSQERVWRRAILEQAVDLSLSSSDVQPGVGHEDAQDAASLEMTFAPRTSMSTERESSSLKSSTRSKKGWWSKKTEKEKESGRGKEEGTKSVPSQSSGRVNGVVEILADLDPHNIGQAILPNLAEEISDLERNLDKHGPVPLALKLPPSFPFSHSSVSAPPTPIYLGNRSSPIPMIALSPRPSRRPTEAKPPAPSVREDFLPGHSTIKKSLSTPLLSDMHKADEFHDDTPDPSHEQAESIISFEGGGGAPSLVLQNPHRATSNPTESFLTASQSDYHDEMYDAVMEAENNDHHRFGMYDVERWSMSRQSHVDGRPSFDSFSPHQPYHPPPRLSSTFGFRHSNLSLVGVGGNARHIEVDISGDPMDHLTMLEQRGESPGAESQSGYVSAMDHTFYSEDTLSMTPSSPSQSFLSTQTRLPSLRSHNQDELEVGMSTAVIGGEEGGDGEGDIAVAPISFFDSVQHQSYMESAHGDHDGASTSDSESEPDIIIDESDHDVDAKVHEPVQSPVTIESHQGPLQNGQVMGRTSLNTTRPTAPAFSTRFPNASQPALPEHKRPLANIPRPSTGGGRLLAQLKSNKGAFPVRKKGSDMVAAPGGVEPLSYATSISSSDGSSTHESVLERTTMRSLPSPSTQGLVKDEEKKKLDGLVMQHLEAEKDRLRRIASAVRKKGGVDKSLR